MNETEIAQALGTTEPRVNTDDALARFRERVETEGIAPVAAPTPSSTATKPPTLN